MYASVPEEEQMQVCVLARGDTWMTPYKRYLADGALPVEPEEGKKVKKCRKIYFGGWGAVQARFHSPYPDMRQWR